MLETIIQSFNAHQIQYFKDLAETKDRLSKLETEVKRLDLALTVLQEARKNQISLNMEHEQAIKGLKNTLLSLIGTPAQKTSKPFWSIFK